MLRGMVSTATGWSGGGLTNLNIEGDVGVQYYQAAVLVDPKHAAAWHGWGMLEHSEGNLVAARDTWIKVRSGQALFTGGKGGKGTAQIAA